MLTDNGEAATELNVNSSGYLQSERHRHTIFKVDGDLLRLGKEGNEVGCFDGMTEAERPVALESERVFIRKISAE